MFREEVEVPGTRKAEFRKDVLGDIGFFDLDNNTYLSTLKYAVKKWRVAADAQPS